MRRTELYRDRVLRDGAVGYWRLGEASGATAYDLAPVPHNGTYAGGVTLGQPGAIADGDTAALFDGTSGVVQIPSLTMVLPITLELSCNPGVDAPQGLFDTGPSTQNTFRNSTAGEVEWWNNDPHFALGLTHGNWYHLVFIFRFDGHRRIDFYRNGSFILTASGSTDPAISWTTLRLGNINNGAPWYGGFLDEVAVYPYAPTAQQVAEHYGLRLATGHCNFRRGLRHRMPGLA